MGGGGRPPRGAGKVSEMSCENLVIHTQLSSPKAAVLINVNKDDILELSLSSPTGPCLVFHREQEVGAIINADLKKIIDCMNQGHDYIAIVRSVEGGKCSLKIKHA
ncbi:hypothetical protein GCM10011405_20080 [Rufibacter glacialis]|nr:hypothetical protein GCM10011405_20080 [Rufibacter glacialis]